MTGGGRQKDLRVKDAARCRGEDTAEGHVETQKAGLTIERHRALSGDVWNRTAPTSTARGHELQIRASPRHP